MIERSGVASRPRARAQRIRRQTTSWRNGSRGIRSSAMTRRCRLPSPRSRASSLRTSKPPRLKYATCPLSVCLHLMCPCLTTLSSPACQPLPSPLTRSISELTGLVFHGGRGHRSSTYAVCRRVDFLHVAGGVARPLLMHSAGVFTACHTLF